MKVSVDGFLKTIALICDECGDCEKCSLHGERYTSDTNWHKGCLLNDMKNEESRKIVKNVVLNRIKTELKSRWEGDNKNDKRYRKSNGNY